MLSRYPVVEVCHLVCSSDSFAFSLPRSIFQLLHLSSSRLSCCHDLTCFCCFRCCLCCVYHYLVRERGIINPMDKIHGFFFYLSSIVMDLIDNRDIGGDGGNCFDNMRPRYIDSRLDNTSKTTLSQLKVK